MARESKQLVTVDEFANQAKRIALWKTFFCLVASLSIGLGVWNTGTMQLGVSLSVSLFFAGLYGLSEIGTMKDSVDVWCRTMLIVTKEWDDSVRDKERRDTQLNMLIFDEDEEYVPIEVRTTWSEIRGYIEASNKSPRLTRDSLDSVRFPNLSRRWASGEIRRKAMALGLVDRNMNFLVGGFVVPEVEEYEE